jgi:hypothetical protein
MNGTLPLVRLCGFVRAVGAIIRLSRPQEGGQTAARVTIKGRVWPLYIPSDGVTACVDIPAVEFCCTCVFTAW